MEIEQIPEVISQTVDALSTKLQVPAEHLYSVMIQGTQLQSWANIIASIVIGFPVLAFAVFIYLYCKKTQDDECLFVIVICLLVFAICIGVIVSNIVGYFAPEYAFLNSIISSFKN